MWNVTEKWHKELNIGSEEKNDDFILIVSSLVFAYLISFLTMSHPFSTMRCIATTIFVCWFPDYWIIFSSFLNSIPNLTPFLLIEQHLPKDVLYLLGLDLGINHFYFLFGPFIIGTQNYCNIGILKEFHNLTALYVTIYPSRVRLFNKNSLCFSWFHSAHNVNLESKINTTAFKIKFDLFKVSVQIKYQVSLSLKVVRSSC